jgi:Histidine phosphatase superfamily (branch 1)
MDTRLNRISARAFSLSLAVALIGSLWVGLTGCAATSASAQRELPTGENTVMAPTVVYLIRHTETDPNAGRDPELTAVGVAKAERLARLLADEPISAIFVTSTIRSYASAAPIATAHGIEFTEYAALAIECSSLRTPTLWRRYFEHWAGRTCLISCTMNTIASLQ